MEFPVRTVVARTGLKMLAIERQFDKPAAISPRPKPSLAPSTVKRVSTPSRFLPATRHSEVSTNHQESQRISVRAPFSNPCHQYMRVNMRCVSGNDACSHRTLCTRSQIRFGSLFHNWIQWAHTPIACARKLIVLLTVVKPARSSHTTRPVIKTSTDHRQGTYADTRCNFMRHVLHLKCYRAGRKRSSSACLHGVTNR